MMMVLKTSIRFDSLSLNDSKRNEEYGIATWRGYNSSPLKEIKPDNANAVRHDW
jgi:hypothetical protein